MRRFRELGSGLWAETAEKKRGGMGKNPAWMDAQGLPKAFPDSLRQDGLPRNVVINLMPVIRRWIYHAQVFAP